MPDKQDHSTKFENLREKAERLIQSQAHSSAAPPNDILELIHELKIHQAELEIQNEELQRAQHEIVELHQEYENLYEFAPCGYLTLDSKGIITHLNLTGCQILDLERGYAKRQGFSNFIHSGFEGIFFNVLKKSGETAKKQSIELPIKRKDDSPLWVRADIEADRDETGAVAQWRMVLLDITEKKNAVAALERSETKYRKMMSSISDPLYVCSPERTIEYLNPAMIKRLGRDTTGEICHKAMQGLNEVCEWCPSERVINGETIEQTIESPLDNRTYRITHMPVLNDDQTVSKMAIYRDITDYVVAVKEKEKAQARLSHAQKMESIGTLAGGIAHEFNNMLGIIIGNTELALDDIPEWNPATDCIEEIRKASLRAKDVVQKLLRVARKAPDSRKPIQIRTIVDESLGLLRKTIPSHIEIRSNLTCTAETILADPTEITQVLMNLCTNSAHAIVDGKGSLEVTLEIESLDSQSIAINENIGPGDYVKLSVSDDGKSIAPDILDRIFEPYFTTKDVDEGLGMGLAVVHGIVKKHEGYIKVESEAGKGTTVEVLFPLIDEQPVSGGKEIETLPTGTERILFVDDETSLVNMATQMLARSGYEVVGKTSSADALKVFKDTPDYFDLVITDMAMPVMTGDRLAQELIKIRSNIPIILCTGHSDFADEERAAKLGINAFAMKPLRKKDLAWIVRKVLNDNM